MLGNAACDCQAQAAAHLRIVRQPVKSIEDSLKLCIRNPRAIVDDFENGIAILATNANGYFSTFGGVAQCIIHGIAQHQLNGRCIGIYLHSRFLG